MKWKSKANLGLIIKYNFNKIKIECVYHEEKNLWDVKVLCNKKSELSEILCKIEDKKSKYSNNILGKCSFNN